MPDADAPTGRPGADSVQRSTAESLWADAGGPDQPFGLYFVEASDPRADPARQLERRVFFETYGNTPELMAAKYDPYEAASVLLCVLDHRRRVVCGMMRMVFPSPAGLKTFHDLEHVWGRPLEPTLRDSGYASDPGRAIDVATIAVAPDYRGDNTEGLVSLALYRGLVMTMVNGAIPAFVATLDLVVLDLIQQRTAHPLRRFAGVEPLRHLDSPSSMPVFCEFEEYIPRLIANDPAMHEIVFAGAGLDPVLWTPDDEQVSALIPAA